MPAAAQPIEVQVRGAVSASEQLSHSAEAVHVVSTRTAQRQSADLGEVLARTQGISVRREAGLGSSTHFSLDGLSDEQIRFFLDGLPLDIAGYPFGIGEVPVNFLDRVEIYRGVVPIRFGADALGGALNLVSAQRPGSHAAASYQVGSFGTHRVTGQARYQDEPLGLFVGLSGFYDRTRNDYLVDVQIPDALGRLHDATVPRFHDRYRGFGITVEAGALDHPWAELLDVRAFVTGFDKDLQSNAVMSVPYGAVTYGERVVGASLHYAVPFGERVKLDVVSGYARRRISFVDVSKSVFDWNGDVVFTRQVPGEISSQPYNDRYQENDVYGRALVSWAFRPDQTLRFSTSPRFSDRVGQDLTLSASTRDPLSALRNRLSLVSGVEHQLELFGGALENIVFVKNYALRTRYEDVLPGNLYRPKSTSSFTFGAGDSLRLEATRWLWLKASYEYATRLPSTDELFGNGVLVGSNLELRPELSHNLNLGPRVELSGARAGKLTVDLNGFLRESHDLIVLLGADQFLSYQNVYDARSLGVELGTSWSAPRRWLTLEGSLTYVDLRNASSEGTFGAYSGDRIPNRPWLFASFGVHGLVARFPASISGVLEPFYVGRFVNAFYRGWESVGAAAFKQTIPAQLSHDLGVTYAATLGEARLSATLEVDNVTDAKLFDSFGAQRPGRAFSFKLTGAL